MEPKIYLVQANSLSRNRVGSDSCVVTYAYGNLEPDFSERSIAYALKGALAETLRLIYVVLT
jgi:hypothetical protein